MIPKFQERDKALRERVDAILTALKDEAERVRFLRSIRVYSYLLRTSR